MDGELTQIPVIIYLASLLTCSNQETSYTRLRAEPFDVICNILTLFTSTLILKYYRYS